MDIALSPTCRLGSQRLFRLFFAERFAIRFAALAAALLVFGSTAHAANVTWSLAGNATAGGNGNWIGGNTWWNGSSGVAWTTGDNATFSAAGDVTVNSDVTAGTLTYSNSTTNIQISNGAGNLTINSGITATNTANTGARQFTIAESNVILGGNNTWTVNNGGATGTMTLAVQNAVSGGFGITKVGNGTVSASGNNTYTGATVVNGGNFQVANTGLLGGGNYSGNITIAAGATFTQTSTLNQTLSGNISGAGIFNKSNSGSLTLNGTNTWSGTTGISQGTVNLNGNLTTAGAITVSASGSTSVLNITGSINATAGGPRGFVIANNANWNGTVTVSGSGLLRTNGMMIGEDSGGFATFNQTGGTYNGANGGGAVYMGGQSSTLNVSGGNFSTITLSMGSGSGGATSSSNSTLTVNGTGSVAVTNALSLGFSSRNATAITVNIGDGSLGGSLSVGNLTYAAGASAGPTTVNFNGGTFIANGDMSMPTQATTVVKSGGAIINVVPTKTFTIGTDLTDGGGGGGLTKNGNGNLTLSGTNTYTGATTINAGTLEIAATGRLGAGTYAGAITNNGTLIYSGTNDQTLSGAISGTGALTVNTSTSRTLTLSNAANTYNGATTVSAGTLAVSGNISSSALTVNSGAVISAGSSTGAAKFNAASITINGGSGYNWTLLNGGLGTSAGTDYDQMSTAGALTFNNTAANPFTVYVYGDANDWDGSLNNSWNIMSAGSLSGFNSANFSVNLSNFGVASANRPGIWSFASSGGNITLSYTLATPDYFWNGTTGNWNDSYVPNTTGFTPGPPETDKNIFFSGSGGTVTNNIASGNLTSLAGITFNSTAGAYTLAANAGSAGASGGTAMTVKGDITNNSASTQTINLDIALGGSSTGTVDTAAGNIAMGGKISGSGALVKSGASTLTLSGNNTYTGGTTINAGTIQLNHANGLGTSGSITFGGGGLTYGNQTTDISSRIKNSGSAILIDTNNNNVTYSGVIDSTNVGGLTKAGSGTLTLNASNTYTGATTINAGTLEIGAAGRLGAGTYSGAITNDGTFIYNGTNDQTLSGAISGTGALRQESNSNLTLSGVIGGSGAITKNGTGTLTINNTASTHSGSLTVNSGNLSASGTISSSVALNTGARISVSSNTTAAQFNAGSLTIGAGSGYTFTIARVSTSTAGTDYDQIALSGGLTLNNTAASKFTVYVSGAGTGWSNTGIYHWDIITAASLSGTFAAGNFTTDFSGFSVAAGSRTGNWSFSNPTAGTIRLSYFGTMPGNSTWNTTSASWNATASWVEGVIPVNNNNLTFNGTVGGTATNNISNATLTTVNNITFAAGAGGYTLAANAGSAGANGGTALTVTGAITNNSSNLQTLTINLSITNSPVINTASGNITINRAIAGNGGITKEGNNTLTLSGANTYNGTTNINAGTLALGANQNLKAIAGAGALNLSTFNLSTNASSNTTFSGVISGTGNFTKDGNGMLTLSGNNTYSGATTINAGPSLIGGLTVSHANALGTTANGTTVASNAALQLSGGISIGAEALSLNGTGNNNGGALRNISGNNSYAGTITLAADSRINSDANTLTLSGDITGNTRNLTIGGAGNTTVSGNITTTTGTLTKDGAGTLTLSGNNTYSGNTTISVGTLQVGGAGRLGGGSYSGNISNSGTLIYSGTNNQTLSGVISGIGALTKNAASTLTLSGNNDYSGTTTISAGALRATHANALGSTAAGTTVASGAALELSGDISIGAEALSLAGTGISTGGALRNISGNNSYAGAITLAANSRINSDANTLTLSGDITGNARNLTIGGAGHTTVSGNITTTTGTLTKDGAGTLTLSGVNTYSGATTINSGTLVVNGSAANSAVTIGNTGVLGGNGTVGALTVQSGGRVAPGNSPGNLNVSTLTLNGGGGYNWEITNVSGTAGTDWDLITVGGGTGAATISATSGNKFTIYISGNPTGWDTNAPFDWNIIDWGTVTGFDANAFAVDTTGFTGTAPVGTWTFSNTAGYLNLAYTVATDPIWSGASGNWTTGFSPALTTGNKSITFAGAAGGTATNDIASGTVGSVASITFNSTAGAYTLAANTGSAGYDTASALQLLGNIVNNSTATQTINLALTSTATRVYDAAAGNLTIGGVISGTGGLTKNGSNLLTLSANNTYSGDTTINAGTVQITTTGLLGGGNYSGNIANNGALLLGSNSNQTLGGVISGTGALTKNGTGTLTLVGNNNYSGNTTLNTGTVVIGHANAAGTGRIVQTNGSSVLKIDTAGTISNDMSVYNVLATQSATLSGAITVNNATWDIDTGDTLTISGAVSGTGGVTKIGNGTLILSGSNSYNGSTVINAGTLNAANANALGSNNTVQVNGGTLLVSTDDAINGKNIVMAGSGVGLQFSGTYSGAIGNLTLSADSIIDLGTGSVQILFQGLTLSNHTLSFYNWNGTTLWNGGTGADTDRVYFGPDLSDAALAKIYFYSGPGDSFLGSGFDLGLEATGFTPAWGHQIIPVPEPETWATGILLVLGGGVWLWRKRRNFTTQPDLEGAAPSAPQEGRASAPIDKMVGLFRRNDPHQRQSRPHALPAKSVMI